MSLSSWSEIKQTCQTNGMSVYFSCPRNAASFAVERQVTLEEATAKATQMNIMFMETSAKAGHNVKSLFKKIAMSLPGMEKESGADANTSTSQLFMCLILAHSFPPW